MNKGGKQKKSGWHTLGSEMTANTSQPNPLTMCVYVQCNISNRNTVVLGEVKNMSSPVLLPKVEDAYKKYKKQGNIKSSVS